LSATASAVAGIPGESDFSASPSMPRRSRKMERSSSRGAHCGRAGRVVDDRGYSKVMPSASLRYVAQSTVLPSGSSTSVGLGVGEEDAVAEATAADGVADAELNGSAGVQTTRESEIAAANEPDATFLRRATDGSMSLPSSGFAPPSSPVGGV